MTSRPYGERTRQPVRHGLFVLTVPTFASQPVTFGLRENIVLRERLILLRGGSFAAAGSSCEFLEARATRHAKIRAEHMMTADSPHRIGRRLYIVGSMS